MRIRTLKPEFWANEKMAGMPDAARLLAIGLLNYADDDGFFWANEKMIRGALCPFDDDSTIIRRSLAQLASIGYIRLGKAEDGRECGEVVNFSKHQRIDRPKPSEIKGLAIFDDQSTINRRSIVEPSTINRRWKGRERKGKEGKGEEDVAPEALPFSSPEFSEAWSQWQQHRTEIRKPLKPTMRKAQLAELAAMGEQRAIAALRHTIAKGWQGIREPEQGERANAIPANSRALPASTSQAKAYANLF